MNTEKQWSFVMAERLKQLRGSRGLSHERLSSALSAQYGINISSDSLMNYEVASEFHSKKYKNLGMRIEYLRYFADFYNVSTDYLLGLTDTKSKNEDVQAVCRVTGLKEDYICNLMSLGDPEDVGYLREMVDEFLSYAIGDFGIVTYKNFRKYVDMLKMWDGLSSDEYRRQSEEIREMNVKAERLGYMLMTYGDVAKTELKKFCNEYKDFLLEKHWGDDAKKQNSAIVGDKSAVLDWQNESHGKDQYYSVAYVANLKKKEGDVDGID